MIMYINSLNSKLNQLYLSIGSTYINALKTLFIQISSQGIRLISNVLFTYFFIPEYFGIMAIVNVWVMGIQLLSDVGLNPAVQRSQQCYEKSFQQTAWTIQVLRGLLLFLITLLLAPLVSTYYNEPRLEYLIYIVSTSLLINGFCNIEIIVLPRKGFYSQAAFIELKAQVISIAFILCTMLFYTHIIQLAAIPVLSSILRFYYSHNLKERHRYKLNFNYNQMKELINYGSIIFISSALSFIAQQYDKVNLGKILDMHMLGLFAIAVSLSEAPRLLVSQMSAKFLIPLFSNYQTTNATLLNQTISKKRFKPIILLALCMATLSVFSTEIVNTLYSNEYHVVGSMLSILLIGSWPIILCISYDSLLYTHTKPWFPILGQCLRFFHLLWIPIIFKVYGLEITVIWIALRDIWYWIVIQFGMKKMQHSYWKSDIVLTTIFFSCIYIMTLLKNEVFL